MKVIFFGRIYFSAVVITGATGAIAPVDFWKEALIALNKYTSTRGL